MHDLFRNIKSHNTLKKLKIKTSIKKSKNEHAF